MVSVLIRPILIFVLVGSLSAQTSAKRPIKLDDLERFHDVSAPEVSPDGNWIAYTVSNINKEADKRETHIWMVSWDGTQTVQLTSSSDSESSPRWSPDGKYISFMSARPGKAKGNQVWVLDRRGGEGRQLTELKGMRIGEYQWAGDSKKLLLTMRESDEPEAENEAPRAGAP